MTSRNRSFNFQKKNKFIINFNWMWNTPPNCWIGKMNPKYFNRNFKIRYTFYAFIFLLCAFIHPNLPPLRIKSYTYKYNIFVIKKKYCNQNYRLLPTVEIEGKKLYFFWWFTVKNCALTFYAFQLKSLHKRLLAIVKNFPRTITEMKDEDRWGQMFMCCVLHAGAFMEKKKNSCRL